MAIDQKTRDNARSQPKRSWTFHILGWPFLVLTALVLASGLYQTFFYEPSVLLDGVTSDTDLTLTSAARLFHFGVSCAWVAALFIFLVTKVLNGADLPSASFAASLILTPVALITGFYLPWDQLALAAVTVGADNMTGYVDVLSGDILFVLRGNSVVSTQTFSRTVIAHLASGLGAMALAVFAASRIRRTI